MTSSFLSDTGLVRENNEDTVRVDDLLGIYLLADGMGGHNGGEVASAVAVEAAYAFIANRVAATSDGDLDRLVPEALQAANQAVFTKSRTDIALTGMGTTLVAAVVRDGVLHLGHVGDSRGYLFKSVDGSLRQLTEDQSVGARLVRSGTMTKEQVPAPFWNMLEQAVGTGHEIHPQYFRQIFEEGDLLLLCSDGLTNMLADGEIAAILAMELGLAETAERLVAVANAKGGEDNVSVVLVGSW